MTKRQCLVVKAAQRASIVPNAQTGSLLVVALPRTEPSHVKNKKKMVCSVAIIEALISGRPGFVTFHTCAVAASVICDYARDGVGVGGLE
jgi:hypothetical protein